jgi:lipid-binding SYLF domain-containing protein
MTTRTEARPTRRGFLASGIGLGAVAALAACSNPIGSGGAAEIDARVDATRDYLFANYPGTRELAGKAHGILWMPLVTEAGFWVGGGFGRGALRIDDVTVDYYSATRATVGLQIGAQQFAHALFFMTETALGEFRASDGWALGADARIAVPTDGASIGRATTEVLPVIPFVFGQSGLMAGATIAGIKYTRIIP